MPSSAVARVCIACCVIVLAVDDKVWLDALGGLPKWVPPGVPPLVVAPLAKDAAMARRYAEVDLYLPQCHAERDLEAPGRALRDGR